MDLLTNSLVSNLSEQLSVALASNQISLARQLWIQCASLPVGFAQLTKLQNTAKKIIQIEDRNQEGPRRPTVRLAILGNATAIQLKASLKANLEVRGHATEFYESPFDSLEQEIYDPQSGLYNFNPNHILLLTSDEDLLVSSIQNTAAEEDQFWSKQSDLWDQLRTRLPQSQVIQSTFAIPSMRTLGHLETRLTNTRYSFFERLNRRLRTEAPAGISLIDMDFLASWFGKARWFDRRFWYHSKHAFSIDATSIVSSEVVRILTAAYGQSFKCLVLDLDNTLWGGVIGDDGLDGIEIAETADGEAFYAFQSYVKGLKERGVILAVCSKNFEEVARQPFLNHPQMLLKEADIACFVANWENKADNIRSIAQTLEIGLDALVFFDDNPAERNLVRMELPQVFTVEVPRDAADYVATLDNLGLFEIAQFTQEDLRRADQYRENSKRKEHAKKVTSLDDYLDDLKMIGRVESISSSSCERALQLINKSNQFNLMTHRYTASEFNEIVSSPFTVAFSIRLEDRFGDNGTVAVVICSHKKDTFEIRDWVMSCRVLSRGMEQFTFNAILAQAKSQGLSKIQARYIPSGKNQLVANLLPSLGFELINAEGTTQVYEFNVSSASVLKTFIKDSATDLNMI